MKKITLSLLLLFPLISFSQKEGNVWMLGYGDGVDSTYATMTMDFNVNPPLVEQRFQNFSFILANSSICDINGNLLLYSNGIDIQNNNDEIIINGEDFQIGNYPLGFPAAQSSIVLPYPNKKNEYLFFTSDIVFYNNPSGVLLIGGSPYNYSHIKKNANEDWIVEEKKIPLIISDTLLIDHLTAVRHSNGRDWWVINSKYETNQFYRFLVSPNGVFFEGIQEVGDTTDSSLGQTTFSPDGNWYAKYNTIGNTGVQTWSQVELYQFDRCTGLLSNHQHELLPGEDGKPGGVAFSPNSELLYISAWDSIYQYNLGASDILASRQMVAATDEFMVQDPVPAFTKFFMMQLAPNDKIYISVANVSSKYLHVIDNPNELGTACNVLQHHIELPTFNNFSLPNLPHFSLKADIGSPCDTVRPIAQFTPLPDMLAVSFTDESQRLPTEWYWTFGDGNSSTEQHPNHIYTQLGMYEVCLIVSNEAGSDTTCQMIEIIIDDVDEFLLIENIKISPNPTDGNVLLEIPLERSDDWQINIYDIYGRALLQKTILRSVKKERIYLDNFSKGIYFYEINQKEQLIKKGKIIKQ